MVMTMWTSSGWAALTSDLEVTGYKFKAFYDLKSDSDEIMPTSGDLRYRENYGLQNYGGGTRSAIVTIPVKEGDLLIIQKYTTTAGQDINNLSVTINRGSANSTVTSTINQNGVVAYDISADADDVTFSNARYASINAVLVMEKDGDAATADYTLNYKIGDEIIKSSTGNMVVGGTLPTDASFFVGDVKYFRADGEPESFNIGESNNTFNVNVRLAATYNYTLESSLGGTIASDSGLEGETVTVGYPRYIVNDGAIYEAAATNKEYRKGINLTADNASATITYTVKDGVNAVFYAEGEDIDGMTVSTTGNIPVRASNAKAGVSSEDINFTTLPAAKYILHVGTFTSKSSEQKIYIGSGENQLAFSSSSNLNEATSSELTIPQEITLTYFGTTSSADAQLDYIWIEKTADLTPEEIAEIEAQATNKQALKDKIQEAEAIDTTGKNGADDLAAAITAAKAVKDAESKTAAEYAAATQALQDAIDAFNAANPATPVATWRDIKIDLTNGNLLEDSEKEQWGNIAAFGIAVAEDGTVSRVAADADNAACVVSGKWHSNQCWASVNITVNVEGPVKVTSGTQPWSDSPTTVKVGDETVASFSNKGTIWTSTATGNVVSGYYRGTEAATLTIDGGGYPTYIAIEAVDPADLPAEVTEYTVTFDKATSGAEGIAPEAQKVEAGSKATIPANTSLYIEGQTLTAWTDGENQYKAGDEVTVNADITLTPVFTENAIAFSDRTEPVTITWDATKKTGGAPAIGIEGNTGFIVAQAVIGENTIDVKAIIDATSGKFNNSNGEWIQINNGTKITLPAYKGTEYTVYSMGDSGDATFNGENGTYASNNTTYTYNGDAETMEIVIGAGSWFKTFTAVYPAPAAPVVTHTWDFTQWSDETVANLKAEAAKTTIEDDPDNAGCTKCTNNDALWSDHEKVNKTNNYTASHDNCFWYIGGEATPTANGKAIEELKGLEFNTTYGAARSLAIAVNYGTVMGTYAGGSYLWLGSKNQNCFTIKNVKAGTELTMAVESHKLTSGQEDPRGVKLYAGEVAEDNVIGEAFTPTTLDTKTWTVPGEEGQLVDVVVTNTNGCHIYYIDAEIGEPVLAAVNVSYSLEGLENVEGVLTAEGGEYTEGDKLTLPAKNYNLYKEGYTMTGWTDGENTYELGAEITLPAEDVTLKPVFTENTVSLADRTAAVTLNFDLEPTTSTVNIAEGQTGVVVTQATVKSKTIDVAMKVDNTYGEGNGKLVNAGRESWCQANANTKMTVPSAKNATVEMKGYGNFSTTTIDGQTDYEGTGTATITATVASSTETVDIILGSDCGYLSYVKVTLPAIEQQGDVVSYDNEAATITWAGASAEGVATPKDGFKLVTLTTEHLTSQTTATPSAGPNSGLLMLQFTGDDVADGNVQWIVQPAKGLTFTPTKVSGRISRFATDGITMDIVVLNDEGTTVTLAEGLHPTRNNKTQADDKWGGDAKYAYDFNLNVPATLATTKGFTLKIVNSKTNRQVGFADIKIEGTVDGTIENVAKYTLTTATNIEEAGSVSVYPVSAEYEEGSEVKLTATENFGYDFVNWTDADNQVVSEEPVFTYTMNADATLTANFQAVETYELKLTVDGTNDYMVKISPAPTMVDDKMMYEAGTAVQLTADQYENLVTFTNWSDGETANSKIVSMTEDVELTAYYAQADIIAGWDFYKKGNSGRKADFYAQDNDADALNLVNTETGESSGWLDKSAEALNGGNYEGLTAAATNWRTGASNGDVGYYHWQTKVNAEAFTDINVQFLMLYNYNAYKTYNVEYSLDGEAWTNFGSITMENAKKITSFNETMPAAANNQKDLYIRMIADKTSIVDGAASANDGNTLAMFFITGTPKLVNDGVAPVLVSNVPENGATGASATGKIVLTFDERVKVTDGATAQLGNLTLTPTVSGKAITFEYKGLEYGNEYTFFLPSGSVADLTDNVMTEGITLTFTTMERPSIAKGLYDAVVSTSDELVAAIAAAQARTDKTVRFRIFIKNGNYVLPLGTNTKDYNVDVVTGKDTNGKNIVEKQTFTLPDPITYITSGNISFIGESRDGVIITNGIDKSETFESQYGTTSKYDGIGQSDVFQISGSDYYFQDLTIETGMDDATGRDLAIHDKATRTIYKNTGLRGYQDTWTSNNDRGLYYFEGGYVRGRTDYMCGKGDAFFNGVELRQIAGGYAAVPSNSIKYGFVYKDCTINGEPSVVKVVNGQATETRTAAQVNSNYTLGRPWGKGTPVALYIDTKMNVVPSAIGWNEMSGGYPKQFAEWNSTTSTGSVVDLSGRKTTFDAYDKKETINGQDVYTNRRNETNVPVLTAAEALEAGNMHNMFGEWDPTIATEQAPVPANVQLSDNALTWNNSDYVLLWAIVKDGEVVDFTIEPTYTVTADGVYAVRAANQMGGLSEASESVEFTAIADVIKNIDKAKDGKTIYNLQGVRVKKAQKGLYIINGKKALVK